jgi:selenocysteine lyase/cysteine desulfurase
MSNMLPIVYRAQIERNFEPIRRAMAKEFGCDPEEIAFTRNSSEALQIA